MKPNSTPETPPETDLRQIQKWTRRYAQNRAVPFLVSMVIFIILFIGTGATATALGFAIRAGNPLAIGAAGLAMAMCYAAITYFSLPKYGGKLVERLAIRIYGAEGYAAIATPAQKKKPHRAFMLIGPIFGLCILTTVALGLMGHIPIDYMQPVSALYMVPFLVFLFLWQRPVVGPINLLWPALYALHAILIVAGVPILFRGPYEILNMLLPAGGYGLLAGALSHLYSRHALRKLKQAAAPESGGGQ